jgi:hypothetical protein
MGLDAIFYRLAYRGGRPRWDTGVVSTNLRTGLFRFPRQPSQAPHSTPLTTPLGCRPTNGGLPAPMCYVCHQSLSGVASLRAVLPIFRWGADCSGARLRTDLIAGATVRVVMTPVEM